MPVSSTHHGWHRPPQTPARLEIRASGTQIGWFSDSGNDLRLSNNNGLRITGGGITVNAGGITLDAGGLTVTDGGLLVTAGGFVLTAGVLSIDDTTESSSAVTGSLHTDGGVGIAKNLFLALTLEAGADGVGSDAEQLTSGGAGQPLDWSSAGSLREFKHVGEERTDAQEVLDMMVTTPVYDFKYRDKSESEKRIMSTGDLETQYTGIMADEAPWAMHHKGRILNPTNTFGYTMLAIKALNEKIEKLEAIAG